MKSKCSKKFKCKKCKKCKKDGLKKKTAFSEEPLLPFKEDVVEEGAVSETGAVSFLEILAEAPGLPQLSIATKNNKELPRISQLLSAGELLPESPHMFEDDLSIKLELELKHGEKEGKGPIEATDLCEIFSEGPMENTPEENDKLDKTCQVEETEDLVFSEDEAEPALAGLGQKEVLGLLQKQILALRSVVPEQQLSYISELVSHLQIDEEPKKLQRSFTNSSTPTLVGKDRRKEGHYLQNALLREDKVLWSHVHAAMGATK